MAESLPEFQQLSKFNFWVLRYIQSKPELRQAKLTSVRVQAREVVQLNESFKYVAQIQVPTKNGKHISYTTAMFTMDDLLRFMEKDIEVWIGQQHSQSLSQVSASR